MIYLILSLGILLVFMGIILIDESGWFVIEFLLGMCLILFGFNELNQDKIAKYEATVSEFERASERQDAQMKALLGGIYSGPIIRIPGSELRYQVTPDRVCTFSVESVEPLLVSERDCQRLLVGSS